MVRDATGATRGATGGLVVTLHVYGPKATAPHVPKPRTPKRRTFTATVAFRFADVVTLDIAAGCWQVETDKLGDRVATTRDPRRRPWLTVGDRLVVSPVDLAIDEVAMVRIVKVEQNAHVVHATIVTGKLSPSITAVHVMPVKP